MREDLKDRHLSFTEIAKTVGEHWQNLSISEKQPYESQACAMKERYNNALVEYKKTENYKIYMEYLVAFKARHSAHIPGMKTTPYLASSDVLYELGVLEVRLAVMEADDFTAADVTKRPKLGEQQRSADSGTGSSVASLHDIPDCRPRNESISSMGASWYNNSAQPSPPVPATNPAPLTANHNKPITRQHPSPTASSPMALPGFRESRNSVSQSCPWTGPAGYSENTFHGHTSNRGKLEDATQPIVRPSTSAGGESFSYLSTAPTAYQFNAVPPVPALLHSESSTSRSSASSGSNIPQFPLRGPLEPSLDRPPLSSTLSYPKKAPSYEAIQLAPFRPSLSPQSSLNTAYQGGKPPEHTLPLQGLRPLTNHASPPPMSPASYGRDSRMYDYGRGVAPADPPLDPFTALIKAGEMVERKSKNMG